MTSFIKIVHTAIQQQEIKRLWRGRFIKLYVIEPVMNNNY